MSTTELVIDARNGDRDAFGILMRSFEPQIISVCRRFTKSEDDAEDLALETFVEAYQKLSQLREPEAFGSWLYRIATNLCRSWYRSQHNAPVPLTTDPPAEEEEEDSDDLVWVGMAEISEAHRRVLELHYNAGLTYEEIARELDVPIGTVMSRMHRARGALRGAMDSIEDNVMADEHDLTGRFQMEVDLLEALAAEAEAVEDIRKVKAESEPMVRLRQVLETHPPRLIDLLRLSETDERLQHLAGVARHAMHATMPVMASCCLSDEEELRERATRMAGFWVVSSGSYGMRALDLFLDAVVRSPAESAEKAALLLRMVQAVRHSDSVDDDPRRSPGYFTSTTLTCVLLGYPAEAFPLLWDALWEIPEDDLVEHGPRKAIGHLAEPFTDAAMEVVRSGDRDRILHLLAEIRPIFSARSPFGHYMPNPRRLYRELEVLLEVDDEEIVKKARSIGVGHQEIDTSKLIAQSRDPSARIRAKAIRRLGKRVEVSAKQVLLERIEADEDFEVRKAAVQAYGRVAEMDERQTCLAKITQSGDRKLLKAAARALYSGSGPRQHTALESRRIQRIRGDANPKKHIDPIHGLRSLPEIRDYEEDELTKHVAKVCTDWSTTRRQMVMEGRYALMVRTSGVYSFTEIGEAVWRVGRFIAEASVTLGVVEREDGHTAIGAPPTEVLLGTDIVE